MVNVFLLAVAPCDPLLQSDTRVSETAPASETSGGCGFAQNLHGTFP